MQSLTPAFFAAFVLSVSGCAGGNAQAAPTQTASVSVEQQYAAALEEAFSQYEAEIRNALNLEYSSRAEAEAVSISLSPRRFDYLLAQALRARGTTTDHLASFAESNPRFFHGQQQRYWGHLQMLHRAAESVALMGPEPAEPIASR